MAKTSGSDTSHPAVKALAKYHFWLLALVVPLVLVPPLFMARGELAGKIDEQRAAIATHLQKMKEINETTQHPNESWMGAMDESTMAVRQETFAEWRRLWASQQSFRTWPEGLGKDFVTAAESLKPDGTLSRNLRDFYRNTVLSLVRDLPKRMGVEDAMVDPRDSGEQRPAGLPVPVRRADGSPAAEESPYLTTWTAENQNRIAASFIWDRVPSTTQVLLAQEELWVYGLFCDVVARLNESAKGPHEAAIAVVNELAVGYPAAEDNPGGQNGGRIRRMAAATGVAGGPVEPPMGPGGPAGGGPPSAARPPHPRFSAAPGGGAPAGMPAGPPGEADEPVVSPDDQLRNWIYVNFAGKPLDYAQLAAERECQMVHLMPFVLQVVIDERKIDDLLAALANTPIPIDVSQLRINATAGGAATGQPAGPVPGPAGSAGRSHDVQLELRGTVGLATPPDVKTVGLEPGQVQQPGAPADGEKPVAVPRAESADHPVERRRVA